MAFYLRGGPAARMMKRFKDFLHSHPTAAELTRLYSRQAVYADDKIKRLLDFEPVIDLQQGLTRCVGWLEHHGI